MSEIRGYLTSQSLAQGVIEHLSFSGEEGLNQLFSFCVELTWGGATPLDVDALLEEPHTLRMVGESQEERSFVGMISEMEELHDVEPTATVPFRSHLKVTLVPRVWQLTVNQESEIFQQKTPVEIINQVFARHGLKVGQDVVWDLQKGYPEREFLVQYNETDWDFFSRLCEYWGWVCYFVAHDGRDVLMITDHSDHYEVMDEEHQTLVFDRSKVGPVLAEFRTIRRRVTRNVVVHDYNYRTPMLGLHSQKPTADNHTHGQLVNYGYHAKTPEESARFAQVRAESIACQQSTLSGKSYRLAVASGKWFELESTHGPDGTYLVTHVRWHYQPTSGGDILWNEFKALSVSVPFRAALKTPRPKVEGMIHAKVDGAIRGDYAEIDEAGRYKVTFSYDRSGRTDMQASRPLRMLQPHVGADYGLHFPLRPGTEVMVGFVEGDPDRPVIVGAVPNPLTRSPVESPNHTQNVLRSASRNEVVMEDFQGQERVRVHTPRYQSTMQLGAQQEPEQGILLTTEAHQSHVSHFAHSVASEYNNALSAQWCSLSGQSAVALAGFPSLSEACAQSLPSLSGMQGAQSSLEEELEALTTSPEDSEEDDEDDDDGEDDSDDEQADSDEEQDDTGGYGAHEPTWFNDGLWSGYSSKTAQLARNAALEALRDMAERCDEDSSQSSRRSSGNIVGSPVEPLAASGSKKTAALFGRRSAHVFGERAAALSSNHTAQIVGAKYAQILSPATTEISGAEQTLVTSGAMVDVSAPQITITGGYHPEQEAPPLPEDTSIGVMARGELHLVSVEDCILSCAQKNWVAAAHEGSMKLSAKKTIELEAESYIQHATSSEVYVENRYVIEGEFLILDGKSGLTLQSKGEVTIKAPRVRIDSESVEITGSLSVGGRLTVAGTSELSLGQKKRKNRDDTPQ
jgi:type VI secretion system VgrG family protein